MIFNNNHVTNITFFLNCNPLTYLHNSIMLRCKKMSKEMWVGDDF